MKITLLLLPLFIAICSAVSKNHLTLRKFTSQVPPVQIIIPGGAILDIRATVSSKFKQRVTISNGQGISYTWEGSGEGGIQIGESPSLEVPAKGYSWTVKMDWYQSGNWKPSQIKAPPKGYTEDGYTTLNVFGENGDDKDFNDCVVYFTYHFEDA